MADLDNIYSNRQPNLVARCGTEQCSSVTDFWTSKFLLLFVFKVGITTLAILRYHSYYLKTGCH